MRKFFLIIYALLTSINLSLSADFIKGDVYQNNFYDALGTGVTISFPPGEWKVTKVNKEPYYSHINFKNIKKGANLYLTIPNREMGGYFRKGIDKCKSKKDRGNLYTVHAAGVLRERLAVSYCIQSVDFKNNDSYLNILLEAQRRQGKPLVHAFYNLWYPKKYSNVETLSKNQLKAIGESMLEAFKNNINRKPSDFSFVNELLKSNKKFTPTPTSKKFTPISTSNSKKFSSLPDKEICLRATVSNGLGWENVNSNFGDYVKEAFKRKISLYECRKLTNRFPKTEAIVETAPEASSVNVKDKLKELKAMLDEGLISQELYDTKSAKLLEDF